MKKNILFLLVLLSLFACGGDDGGGGTASGGSEYLNVSNVDLTGDKTSATLSIQASPNCEWNISCNDSWVSNIAPSSGRGSRDVTITLSGVNPSSSSSRFATITVRKLVMQPRAFLIRQITVRLLSGATLTGLLVLLVTQNG